MIPRPPAIHGPRDPPVVDFTPSTTIFFVHWFKSNLGEALMPVLSLFLRVPQVSALVLSVASAAKLSPPRAVPAPLLRRAAACVTFARPR